MVEKPDSQNPLAHNNRLYQLVSGELSEVDPGQGTPEPEKPLQRANRRLRQRAVTLPGKLSRAKLAQLKRENAAALSEYPGVELPGLPQNFGECLERFGETGPCPFVRCKHHMALDVKPAVDDEAAVKLNFPGMDVLDIPETCSLRSAVLHPEGQTLERVASYMNITRERARQIEAAALLKMRGGLSPFHPADDYDDHWDDEKC